MAGSRQAGHPAGPTSIAKDGNKPCLRSVQEIKLPKARSTGRPEVLLGQGLKAPAALNCHPGPVRSGAGPEGGRPVPGRLITALRALRQKKILHVCL